MPLAIEPEEERQYSSSSRNVSASLMEVLLALTPYPHEGLQELGEPFWMEMTRPMRYLEYIASSRRYKERS